MSGFRGPHLASSGGMAWAGTEAGGGEGGLQREVEGWGRSEPSPPRSRGAWRMPLFANPEMEERRSRPGFRAQTGTGPGGSAPRNQGRRVPGAPSAVRDAAWRISPVRALPGRGGPWGKALACF